jgi:putative hydrolase of the HAD superfamily
MTKHLVFDFFGTLVSYSTSRTEQGYERSFDLLRKAGSLLGYEEFLSLWSKFSAEFDESAARSNHEFSMIELASAFLDPAVGSADEEFAREFAETYVSEWNKGVQYVDGVAGLLRRLEPQFTLSIITNTHDPDLVPRHLQRMGIADLFTEIVTSVEFGIRKPAPEIFNHALELLGTSTENCVYIGDNFAADFAGARAAGIRPLLIDPLDKAPIRSEERLQSIFEIEKKLVHL